MARERFEFPNGQGQMLAALLDRPAGPVRAAALFAHCFTCGKDVQAARHIAAGLAGQGLAVLRFDFTGLGASGGEFANTGFSSNIDDLVAAADALRARGLPPQLLVGHSLGGAAVLAAAHRIPEARAVATIAAPADPGHVTGLFRDRLEELDRDGEIEVRLAGRPFRIRRSFLADVASQQLSARVAGLRQALLLLHAPRDAIVGIDNATAIFTAAKHPKSFVSLDDADHLLSRPADSAYAAEVVAAWAGRYLDPMPAEDEARMQARVRVQETGAGRFQQEVRVGRHRLLADEPERIGGMDSGPDPYGLLLAALGACTAMTVRMYADRKALPLAQVAVELGHEKVHAGDCADCTKGAKLDRIERLLHLEGPLEEAQRVRLLEIAAMCPVHRTLESRVEIRTVLQPGGEGQTDRSRPRQDR